MVPYIPTPLPQPVRRPKPRVSRDPKNFLVPSNLRPHVLASDRVTSWLTPYAMKNHQGLLTRFPPEHISQFQFVCANSVVRRTHEGWGAGLLRFNQYCDSINIPEEERMPAPEILLAMFVANCGAGNVSESCITTWLSGSLLACLSHLIYRLLAGLRCYHQMNNAPWLGGEILALARKGSANLVPENPSTNH